MTVTFSWPMIVFCTSLLLGWTGFLLGAIKWLLSRQIASIEERLKGAETKASQAVSEAAESKNVIQEAMKVYDKDLLMRCIGHTSRLGDNELKVERIGGEIRNLPQHRHIQELSERIGQLHGDIEKVAGRLDGIGRAVDLINQFLIEQGGRK